MKSGTAICVENKKPVTVMAAQIFAAIMWTLGKYDVCIYFLCSFALGVTYRKVHLEHKNKKNWNIKGIQRLRKFGNPIWKWITKLDQSGLISQKGMEKLGVASSPKSSSVANW